MLFDIDGTLVDSNYLHIHAWCRAFAEVGVGVESWRIHRSIGMDGSELVKSRAAEAGENAQKRASELHSRVQSHRTAASCIARCPRTFDASPSPGSAGGTRQRAQVTELVDLERRCGRPLVRRQVGH